MTKKRHPLLHMPVKEPVSAIRSSRVYAGFGTAFRICAGIRACGIQLLLFFAFLVGVGFPAQAGEFCSDYGGVIDGSDPGLVLPSAITIDTDCTFQNFPPSNPLEVTVNFQTNDPSIYLIIFDNVIFTGHMACASVEHRIWFSNGADYGSSNSCQDLFIPVESIDKQAPSDRAGIGVPFTYSLTLPSMSDVGGPSLNDLHTVTLWDDLTATGVDLTFVDIRAFHKDSGAPVALVPENDPSAPGGVWTPKNLSYKPIPLIRAGDQIVVEITVVLDDTARNAAGTSFVNTAKWWFGRLIEGVFYEPLPGEWGVSAPMTIVEPDLTVTKSGPDVLGGLNLGEWGEFTIEVENTGTGDAWNAAIRDRLPDGDSGGMCDMTPEVIGLQIEGAETRALVEGADFSLGYSGCNLDIDLLDGAGPIAPGERLIFVYRSKLDADSRNGAMLTNIAGVSRWFNGDAGNPERRSYTRNLTDGTVGIADHQDAHTVSVALSGYFFEKTVENLTSGESPAGAAAPGDRLRYTLRLQTTEDGLSDFVLFDELDALNMPAAFEPGTLAVVGPLPAGAVDNSNPHGGAKGTGVVDIRNLNLDAWDEVVIRFDITLASEATLADGALVTNQAHLRVDGGTFAVSDDPNVNGQADPSVAGDEDPTRVIIEVPGPPPPLEKKLTSPTEATIGEEVVYEIKVPGAPPDIPLDDVVVTDNLHASLEYVGATAVDQDGDPVFLADVAAVPGQVLLNIAHIAAGEQVVVTLRTRVANNDQANAGVNFTSTASYSYAGMPADLLTEGAGGALTIIEPAVSVEKAVTPATPPRSGDILNFALTLTAAGNSPEDIFSDAYDVSILDTLGPGLAYVPGSATREGMPVDPATRAGDGIAAGQVLTWNAGLHLPEGSVSVITYQVEVLDHVGADQMLTNDLRVGWTGLEGLISHERTGSGEPAYNDYFATDSVSLSTPLPGSLLKANTRNTAVIGEPFTYRITVPAEPHSTALYDVRIIDDLDASEADLRFLNVGRESGSGSWTPANTGSGNRLVLEDLAEGIDIPAGEQVVLEVTVVLTDTPANVSGLQFTNTASYTFHSVDNDSGTRHDGGEDITEPMTIVEPDGLTLEKTGPDAMRLGEPGGFILNVHNPSSGVAWNPGITDRLPREALGGMCSVGPGNVTAQIFQADGVTEVSGPMVAGTDFTVEFAGEAACEWRIDLLSPSGGLPSGHRLIVHYDLELDPATAHGIELTNVAGVTRWFSADPDAADSEPRAYVRELTDGTVGVLDHQDAHTITTEAPILVFEKTVRNVTTGQDTGTDAAPGDTLRYGIRITNIGQVATADFSMIDELDRLNDPPVFAPGTLSLVSVPGDADSTGTSAAGGAQGTGRVEIRNLRLGAAGEADDTVVIEFEAALMPVIASGTVVLNQAELLDADPDSSFSDDPDAPGDEDPTATRITSAPVLEVQKTSEILSGDSAILLPGETLRYTLTVKNVGNEDAVDVLLRDDIPANTTYVAGSTALNGSPVADPEAGISPLQAGMPLNAPEDETPGYLPAEPSPDAASFATVTFEVLVDPDVMEGLIIENQGFVSGDGAGSGPMPERPSDDPATSVPDDPTRNVVGRLPLLGAHKTVLIHEDFGSPGVVDPGDVLRYTIRIANFGAIPATGVVLTDLVPANTTYVADSLRLNGAPVGPDGGLSPLVAGLEVQSSDNPGAGIVSPGGSAVVTFEAKVEDGASTGTIIRNQGSVTSDELAPEPTDADGLPSNGHQPTIVVVGDVQLLSVTKEVLVVGGGIAEAGGLLEYVIRATNIGSLPAAAVVITDDLAPPLGDQVTYVADSGTLNGARAGVSFTGSMLTADYGSVHGDLPPGESAIVRFRVRIASAQPIGTTITNTGTVRWSEPARSDSASVSLDLGGSPGSASLNGSVWHDADLDRAFDGGELPLEGWSVELYRNERLVSSALSDAGGVWRLSGLVPNAGSSEAYELRFRASGAGPNTASLGRADSPFIDGPQRIGGITVSSGGNLQNLNLPISPNGAVYNSIRRSPVSGARLALVNAATGAPLPGQCFDDPLQQNQTTALDGFYKFDLNFSDPSCPPGAAYLVEVTPPASGYVAAPSRIIPPAGGESSDPFNVPASLGGTGDAIPATTETCEVTSSASPPPLTVPPRTAGTAYYLHLILSDGLIPGESQIFNNHIPIDPEMDEAVAIAKTSSRINVSKGQLVPYTITVNNVFGAPLYDIGIVDRFPAGFKYVEGSARLDGEPLEPEISGLEMSWEGLELQVNDSHTLQLLLAVGAGVSEGEYVNRAQVFNAASGEEVSGEAAATVRVTPDPTFDCTDVIGKVFDDRNLNGRQDPGEKGLAGVRTVTARGLIATSDPFGRFHITCATVPDENRGSNFILKLDDRSLPTGYRVTTENPRVQRATRGKSMRFNFGATVHRVVGLDVADGIFESESTEMRPQWKPRIAILMEELKKTPAVLRLSYLADVEREGLVRDRLNTLKKRIAGAWERLEGGYRLDIETEVFWRRGGPPK